MRTALIGAIVGSLTGAALGIAGALAAMALDILPSDRVFFAGACGGVLGAAGLALGALCGATQLIVRGRPTRNILAMTLGAAVGAMTGQWTRWSNPNGRQFVGAFIGAGLAAGVLVCFNRWTRGGRRLPMPPQGRWFQFSLRALLVAFALICAGLGLLVNGPLKRHRAITALRHRGTLVSYEHDAPAWLQQLLGDILPALDRVVELRYVKDDDGLASLAVLRDVEELSAYGITDKGARHLAGLPRLRNLHLSGNSISDAGLIHLQSLRGLEHLSLHGTLVSDAGLESLVGLPRLKGVSIGYTKLTDAGLARLTAATELEMLALDATSVGDAGLACLSAQKKLSKLRLSMTKVTDVGMASLASLTGLTELWLDHTLVTDAGIEQIKGLRRMRFLDLSWTQIGDAGLSQIAGMSELCHLRLVGTRVTDAGLEHLEQLPSLQIVDTTLTSVTAEGLRRLNERARSIVR